MTTKKKIIVAVVGVAFLYILYTMFFKKRGDEDSNGNDDTPPDTRTPAEKLRAYFPPADGKTYTEEEKAKLRAAKIGYN